MSFFSIKTTVAAAVFAVSALPAFAQDCGVESAHWIGEDETSSDIATASASMDKLSLVPLNGAYVSLFTLSEQANVRVEAAAQGGGDTVLQLLDQTGRVILEDDDSGGNGSARAETVLDAGTYCVSTRSFDGDVLMAHVRIGLIDHEPLTNGGGSTDNSDAPQCTPDTDAVQLSSGSIDSLFPDGAQATNSINDVAYYRFDLSGPTALSLTAENTSADPVLYLFSNSGELLAENDDFDGYNSRIDMSTPLPAGSYCVGVRALSDGDQPVTVSIFEYDEAAITAGIYDRAETSPPLDGSHPVEELGLLAGRQRVDLRSEGPAVWFSFEVDEPGLILIEGITVGDTDPVLTLFDDVGRQLAYNDDTGSTRDALVTAKVSPGTYVLAVTQAGESVGSIRLLLERYVAVE